MISQLHDFEAVTPMLELYRLNTRVKINLIQRSETSLERFAWINIIRTRRRGLIGPLTEPRIFLVIINFSHNWKCETQHAYIQCATDITWQSEFSPPMLYSVLWIWIRNCVLARNTLMHRRRRVCMCMCICVLRVHISPLLPPKWYLFLSRRRKRGYYRYILVIESTVLSYTYKESHLAHPLFSLFLLSRKDFLASVRHCDYLIFTRRSFASRPRYLTNTAVEKIVFFLL